MFVERRGPATWEAMDPIPRYAPGGPRPPFNSILHSYLFMMCPRISLLCSTQSLLPSKWGMITAVCLAASHRDDLRCDHFNSSSSSRRQVKYSILHKRPAIVHSNFYRFAIAWVADDKAGAQWESSVSSGKSVRIKLFSRGCPVPPKLIAIPRSRYSIFAVRTRSQSNDD